MYRRLFVVLTAGIAVPGTTANAARCDPAAQADLPQLAADTRVSLAGEPTVAAGRSFAMRWRRGEMHGRYPAFLVIAFDGAVRFEGKGFYVLLPKASAAFGISRFADRTRAVIPLYGLGVPRQDTVTVRPLLAGSLKVQWAVVGHDRCKEIVAKRGGGEAAISVEATGAPEIVVSPFAAEQPKQRIFSPAGDRVIEVHEGRYRLVDESSRAEIAERAGQHPRFSPTGRYVAAMAGNGFEILDAVDGSVVYRDSIGGDLAWDNRDSFAIIGRIERGSIAVLKLSVADPVILQEQTSCNACESTNSTALRIDLENNVAVFNSDQRVGAVSLTATAKIFPERSSRKFELEEMQQEVMASVGRQSQVTSFALPKRWELRGGLRFSHLYSEARTTERPEFRNDPHQNALMKFLVKPRLEAVGGVLELRNDAVAVMQWRGVSGTSDEKRSLVRRLGEFGLPIPREIMDSSKARFAREVVMLGEPREGTRHSDRVAKMKGVARRIEQEVSAARGVFVERGQRKSDATCSPLPEHPNDTLNKVYDEFNSSFRFQSGGRIVWITQLQCQEGSGAFHSPSLTVFDTQESTAWFLDRDTGGPKSNVGTKCYTNIAFCDFDVRIFGDRFLLLSSAQSRAIEIFDLDTRRNVFRKYGLPRGDLLSQALLSPDGKLVLQINSDGSFVGFRFADANQLFEGRYVDDEVVVWAPDGRFDATFEGAHYVRLRLPGRVGTYTFEQFSASLKTPGLVAKLLAGETFEAANLVAPPSLSGTIRVRSGRVYGSARAVGDTSFASLLVYQDGLLTGRVDAAGRDSAWTFDVPLLDGTRWVSMVGVDKSGLASLPMGRDLMQPSPRRVHVLSIGIDDYSDPRIVDLGLARSDAKHFAEAIQAIGNTTVVASNRILSEKDATREGVLVALRQVVAAARPGETVMLFFAGHGVRGDDGNYFLATSETRIDKIAETALPWNDVADVLRQSQTRIAVFLDTCHSGAANTSAYSTNDAAAKSLLERIPSSIVVFSASKGRELSEEIPAVGGGAFTTSLVKAIASDRARYDTNRNGAIEISELYRGVKRQVTSITEGRQTPWIARNQMVGDFALF